MWGDHGLINKGFPYTQSAKLPLMVRYAPARCRASTDSRLGANIDLAPTAAAGGRASACRRDLRRRRRCSTRAGTAHGCRPSTRTRSGDTIESPRRAAGLGGDPDRRLPLHRDLSARTARRSVPRVLRPRQRPLRAEQLLRRGRRAVEQGTTSAPRLRRLADLHTSCCGTGCARAPPARRGRVAASTDDIRRRGLT